MARAHSGLCQSAVLSQEKLPWWAVPTAQPKESSQLVASMLMELLSQGPVWRRVQLGQEVFVPQPGPGWSAAWGQAELQALAAVSLERR